MPMYRARSRLKNVSTTTALPIADAGAMKKALSARHAAMEPYVFVSAHPMLKSRLPSSETRKTGRRPKRVDNGRQNSGALPRIAICSDVRYEARWMETPSSSAIFS